MKLIVGNIIKNSATVFGSVPAKHNRHGRSLRITLLK